MPSRFIDRFAVLLLDMARTFMFNVDRFSEQEDFAATYRRIGGKALSTSQMRQIITDLRSTIEPDYHNPRFTEHFPSVRHYLNTLPSAHALSSHELDLVEQVFALHEGGEIPVSYVDILHQLRKTHRLGVVSDIWSKKDLFLQEFARAGVLHLFDVIIFSSDHGCVKPSSRLFRKATQAFTTVKHDRIVFVGDNYQRDIVGAQSVKLATVWINAAGVAPPSEHPQPDHVIGDLRELLKSEG